MGKTKKPATIDFSNLCKNIREKSKFTKSQMADYLRVTIRTYERYETGQVKPGAEPAFRLAGLYVTFSNLNIEFLDTTKG